MAAKKKTFSELLTAYNVDDKAIKWAKFYGSNWKKAWEDCDNGSFLIEIACSVLVPERNIIGAMFECVNSVSHVLPKYLKAERQLSLIQDWLTSKSLSKRATLEKQALENCSELYNAYAAKKALSFADPVSSRRWRVLAICQVVGDILALIGQDLGHPLISLNTLISAFKPEDWPKVDKQFAVLIRKWVSYRTFLKSYQATHKEFLESLQQDARLPRI